MANIGVLGGGQLGAMLAIDAQQHGHRVLVRTDESPGGPAGLVAAGEICGDYADKSLNAKFVEQCDVITSEFENLPRDLLEAFANEVPVRPSAFSIATCQHRRREKEFLRAHKIPHANFRVVTSADQLDCAVRDFAGSAIAKTAAFGYDGKGQIRFSPGATNPSAWQMLGSPEVVVEQFVPFRQEISVVGVRSVSGVWVPFAPAENIHVNGILDHSISPARVDSTVALEAQHIAGEVAAALGHVGTIGVEFFVLGDGSLVVNEMAPRPHNSGHHTIDACVTSQFGQQWRAVLGEPLGDPTQHSAAVMCNLLGDLWLHGEPDWSLLTNDPTIRLHLYGKSNPRPGRKMGHMTILTDDVAKPLALRQQLARAR